MVCCSDRLAELSSPVRRFCLSDISAEDRLCVSTLVIAMHQPVFLTQDMRHVMCCPLYYVICMQDKFS
jgi:hypothetical protein